MGDLRRGNMLFSLKWGICEEKTRDFHLNGGFAKTCDFRVKWGIFEEKTRDFHLNGGFLKRKRVLCGLNGVVLKRKRMIYG